VTYAGGSLYAALDTAALSGPGATVIWYKIDPVLNDGNNTRCTGAFINQCADITSATRISQEECYYCSGRGASGSNYYGTLAVDAEGNVTLVYNYSDNNFYPSLAYTSKRVTARTLHDAGIHLRNGLGLYTHGRWGDYTGVAADFTSDTATTMWISGRYSLSNGNWATAVGMNAFTNTNQP
jgi:hypothetical protein